KTPELIVALDVDTLNKAKALVDKLYPAVKFFKVGSQLFTAYGPEAVKMVAEGGGKVFLDLKFYDIPNTVFASVCSSTALDVQPAPTEKHLEIFESGSVFMITVHTHGGLEMAKAAARGAKKTAEELNIKKPYVVGVTVLTSDAGGDVADLVLERAKIAQEAGLDGVVCSVHEATAVRERFGEDFIIVTPGIRPKGAEANDQKRVATPEDAVKAGANFLVVGRPVIEVTDPIRVAKEILQQMRVTD
ncbi:MAG: orotidine-5'-phosphate decarboxylase, partial [Candidatus Omnitrophota bacterium]